MRVLVVEDERPAREQLVAALHAWDPQLEVVAELDSVQSVRQWLGGNPVPDVIVADIRLTDGLSIDAFAEQPPACPVVYVTAYDRYTLDALEAGGVDYLLKPVETDRVARALDKIVRLREHFQGPPAEGRQRVLVRRGREVIAVPSEEIAWFHTEHRLVFLVRTDGRRFVVDQTLTALADDLDPRRFFRIGRSWIVSLGAVQGFRRHGKGRLLLTLAPPSPQPAVVSADVAAAFRDWLDR